MLRRTSNVIRWGLCIVVMFPAFVFGFAGYGLGLLGGRLAPDRGSMYRALKARGTALDVQGASG